MEQSPGNRNIDSHVSGVRATVNSTYTQQNAPNLGDVVIDIPGNGPSEDENDSTQTGAPAPSLADLGITGSWAQKTIPIVVILFLKILFDHGLGFIVLIGLFITFTHFNGTLKRQIALKDKSQLYILVLMMVFLQFNMLLIYYVFMDHQLQKCLVFMRPNFVSTDIWSLLWIVGITDFVIKFFTVAVKCLITVFSLSCLGFKARGKYYLFVEQCSQFYRLLTPIPVWCYYLSDYEHPYSVVGYCLVLVYLGSKARTVCDKTRDLRRAWNNFYLDVHYGIVPNMAEMVAAGNACPICQEVYSDPVMLHKCKHIFCEECVSIWFDRERTCPMCRAKVADDPSWKDGTTASYVQIF